MHGREKINKDDKDRDIVNIQTAKTSLTLITLQIIY